MIASEPWSVQDLYTRYAMVLAALPAVAGFVGLAILGVPLPAALASIVLGYSLTLGAAYALGLVIDVLARHFGARRDFAESLRVAIFSMTAVWVTGLFNLHPATAILAMLGGLYSLYLLYLGLVVVKRPAAHDEIAYALVVAIAALLLLGAAAFIPALALPAAFRGF